MNKLHLALDDLSVESFATEGRAEARGTVAGHAATDQGQQTCWNTCIGWGDTCGVEDTCYDSCVSCYCLTPRCARDTDIC